MARWHAVAASLREAILNGAYRPGDTIPKEEELEKLHGVSRSTVRRAVAQLSAEGLLTPVRRGGTKVRERHERNRITRARMVHRDERGYYFDPAARPWTALRPPVVRWGPAPHDIAHALGIKPGTEVLIRDRVMGDPQTGDPVQLATSYLPADLARDTVLAEADTGPGGIYDRLEEAGHAPLQWSEVVVASAPSESEATSLKLAPGVPLLRLIRTTRSADGQILEVNDCRMSGEHWEIGYDLPRSHDAEPDR
ncbi:GntR family transcriptional regulator [Streptosporangium sp. NPDC006930]|uniref:GntR family transcriptional regulator n=1 Tax=unclassified Streptosporangium TaxID=2632669 RepID=UPI0034498CD7